MSVEFGASIKLDSNSALQQMRKFAAESNNASSALRRLQNETKATTQGLSDNVFRKYINGSRRASVQTERAVAAIHDQTKAFSKLNDSEKSLISTLDKLNQKYDDSARAEARLIQVRKELRLLTDAGLKTQKEASAIESREAKIIERSTTAYKENLAARRQVAENRKRQVQALSDLKAKYDSVYAAELKEKRVKKELNVLLKKGIIDQNRYNEILAKQKRIIAHNVTQFQRLAGAQSLVSKTARLVSIYSRVFLGLYAGARIGTFIKDMEVTAEKIQLLTDKLEFLTGDSGAYKKLFEMTQQVGIELESANKIITRFAVVTNRAFSIDTMNEWSATLIKSARATGTSTQEMSGALIQITQAMSAGRLMGDEYRSVTENLPLLTVALRDIFGKSTLSLKELSSQGLLTNDVLIQGFERLKVILEGFPDSTKTTEAAIGRLSASWDNFVASTLDTDFSKNLFNNLSSIFNYFSESEGELNVKDVLLREKDAAKESLNIAKKRYSDLEKAKKDSEKRFGEFAANLLYSSDIKSASAEILKFYEIVLRKSSEVNKINNLEESDKKLQALRKENEIEKEILKTKKLIEKIEKGKSIATINKNAELQKNEIRAKGKLFTEGKAGGIDPKEEKRLLDIIQANTEDAIQKKIKTQVDADLRLKGLKTKVNIDDIKNQLDHNDKLFEIQKNYEKRKLLIESGSEARKIGLEKGLKGDSLSKFTKEVSDELTAKNDLKFFNDTNNEVDKLILQIEKLGEEGKKVSAVINRDQLGLLEMRKSGIINEFDIKISLLKDKFSKLKGKVDETNLSFEEQVAILKKAKEDSLFAEDRKLDESLSDKFSEENTALREYINSINDLELARKRNILTLKEYDYNLKKISKEYDHQSILAASVTGELGRQEQVYAGLERGAQQFMDNTGTAYEFFTSSTESLLDGSISFMIDSSKQGADAFRSLINSMLAELQKFAVKRAIIGVFGDVAGAGIFGSESATTSGFNGSDISSGTNLSIFDFESNALGGTYSGKGISAYSGTTVSKPTLFPFAKGIGLMGEDGEEAILPLKRGKDGSLGVKSDSNKRSNKVIVQIENKGSSDTRIVESSATTDINGTVVNIVLDDLRNGGPISDSFNSIGEYR